MSDFVSRAIPSRVADAVGTSARVSKRAEIVNMPWVHSLVAEGKVFVANRGTITTPIASGHVVITQLQPELAVRVPSGTIILPLYIQHYIEASGGTLLEVAAAFESAALGAGTSTAVTPVNANTGKASSASRCVVNREYTADGAAVTDYAEFWRDGSSVDFDSVAQPLKMEWSASGLFVPMVKGPGTLLLYQACGTSSTSYTIVAWAEFDAADLE